MTNHKIKPHEISAPSKGVPGQIVFVLIIITSVITLLAVNGYAHTRYCKAVYEKNMCVLEDRVYELVQIERQYKGNSKEEMLDARLK